MFFTVSIPYSSGGKINRVHRVHVLERNREGFNPLFIRGKNQLKGENYDKLVC